MSWSGNTSPRKGKLKLSKNIQHWKDILHSILRYSRSGLVFCNRLSSNGNRLFVAKFMTDGQKKKPDNPSTRGSFG